MLTSYPTLPLLSDDDLAVSFGGDHEMIGRYRILCAVLIGGLAQREAAEQAGVSERTVRNVLQSYRRAGSIVRMREQSSAPRQASTVRINWYEPALASALAEDPQAGGDRLWQRARELLGEAGEGLSRRSAYRMLARLRAEREREADSGEEIGAIRSALTLLIEDPPITLGATALSQKLLPDENDTLLRGTILRQALRATIDRLRPAGEISTIDREWWPYLICSGEYETGQSRAELEASLALSPSTYSRAKRQGLAGIVAALPQQLVALTESRQSRVSQLLPRTADFVGRRDEQSYYAWRLQTEGIACLWGLPGCGKTALAAELAAEGQRYGQSIVWHSCDTPANARLAGVARGLLAGLAATENEPVGTDDGALLDTLRLRLLLRPTVVILDDLQRTDQSEITRLLDVLHSLVKQKAIRLLLVGQRPPLDSSWAPLSGLGEREARLLWSDLPPLPEAHWQALYDAAAGFPQALRTVAAAYRRAGERARPAGWRAGLLVWSTDAIWQFLTNEEQVLLATIHGLAAHHWPNVRDYVLDTLGLDSTLLDALLQRRLLCYDNQSLRVHPILSLPAKAALDANTALCKLCAQVIVRLDTQEQLAVEATHYNSKDMVQSVQVAQPDGMALIDRLQAALARSVAYLTEGADHEARHLASELSALRAALPEAAWARQ